MFQTLVTCLNIHTRSQERDWHYNQHCLLRCGAERGGRGGRGRWELVLSVTQQWKPSGCCWCRRSRTAGSAGSDWTAALLLTSTEETVEQWWWSSSRRCFSRMKPDVFQQQFVFDQPVYQLWANHSSHLYSLTNISLADKQSFRIFGTFLKVKLSRSHHQSDFEMCSKWTYFSISLTNH